MASAAVQSWAELTNPKPVIRDALLDEDDEPAARLVERDEELNVEGRSITILCVNILTAENQDRCSNKRY